MSPRTIAIAGATGFVGRHVVERLLAESDLQLRCLVRASSDVSALRGRGDRVVLCRGDVYRPDTLSRWAEGTWGLINLAGYRDFWSRRRSLYYDLNVVGAENVYRAALATRVDKVVHVSTPLAYGVPNEIPFDEDTEPGPHPSDYARSKYLADKMYTYLYVRDAAEAIVRALLRPETVGRRYLIGNQRATTREYFTIIGELANVSVPRLNLPESALLPVARVMERVSALTGRRTALPVDILKTTAAGSLIFDGTRAQEELGMEYTPLRVALGEAVEEIRDRPP